MDNEDGIQLPFTYIGSGKWIFVLIMLLLLNAFYLTSAVNAKEVNKQATKSITLSPEQVGANYKKLKGYKVRTVVWIDLYTFGTPYTHAREDSDKYKFDVHLVSNEKVKKNNYIVNAILHLLPLLQTNLYKDLPVLKQVVPMMDRWCGLREPGKGIIRRVIAVLRKMLG